MSMYSSRPPLTRHRAFGWTWASAASDRLRPPVRAAAGHRRPCGRPAGARRELRHVPPEVHGADDACHDAHPGLPPGQHHRRAAAHGHSRRRHAGPVDVGPPGERVQQHRDVLRRAGDGGLVDPDAVLAAQRCDVVAVKDPGDGALAVEMGVDGYGEDAPAGQIAAPVLHVLLPAAEAMERDAHRKRAARGRMDGDGRHGFVRVEARQAEPLADQSAGQILSLQDRHLRRSGTDRRGKRGQQEGQQNVRLPRDHVRFLLFFLPGERIGGNDDLPPGGSRSLLRRGERGLQRVNARLEFADLQTCRGAGRSRAWRVSSATSRSPAEGRS